MKIYKSIIISGSIFISTGLYQRNNRYGFHGCMIRDNNIPFNGYGELPCNSFKILKDEFKLILDNDHIKLLVGNILFIKGTKTIKHNYNDCYIDLVNKVFISKEDVSDFTESDKEFIILKNN
jgi:hypothetical protein